MKMKKKQGKTHKHAHIISLCKDSYSIKINEYWWIQ